jgi:hypothetical protein
MEWEFKFEIKGSGIFLIIAISCADINSYMTG